MYHSSDIFQNYPYFVFSRSLIIHFSTITYIKKIPLVAPLISTVPLIPPEGGRLGSRCIHRFCGKRSTCIIRRGFFTPSPFGGAWGAFKGGGLANAERHSTTTFKKLRATRRGLGGGHPVRQRTPNLLRTKSQRRKT